MNEKEFDELLKEESIDKNFQKQLKRKMNNSIYSKALITILVCCLSITVLYYGNSLFLNATNYNPHDDEDIVNQDFGNTNGFAFLFATYYQLQHSGIRTSAEWDTKDLGFGKYEIPFQIEKNFSTPNRDVIIHPTTDLIIDKSRFYMNPYDVETAFAESGPLFRNPKASCIPAYDYTFDQLYHMIQELPTSSFIDSCISFKEIKTIEEIADLIHTYPNVTFDWIALYDQEAHFISNNPDIPPSVDNALNFGISLNREFFNPIINDKYPCLYLNHQEITAKTLRQNYQSSLKLLLDNPEFLNLMSRPSHEDLTTVFQRNYEKSEKELYAYGIRVYAKKDDLIKLMDELDISFMMINDEKSSVFAN